MIKRAFTVIFIFFAVILSTNAFASQTDINTNTLIEKQLDSFNLDRLNSSTISSFSDEDGELLKEFNFKDMTSKVIDGSLNLNIGSIFNYLIKILFKEVLSFSNLVGKILIIAVFSAILKSLNSSFNRKEVGELSFYICYIVLITIIMTSFGVASEFVNETIERLVNTMQAMIPVFMTILMSTGKLTQASIIGPFILSSAEIISYIIKVVFLPAISLLTVLSLVNYISGKDILSQMTSLLNSAISWGMKSMSIIFMTIVSLQRIGTPEVSRIVGKTTKAVVGSVPVVGDAMTGAVEVAAMLAGTVKNGLAVVAVIFIVLISLIPIIKLVAMSFIYKVAAAIIQPISDTRIVKCLNSAGNFIFLLLGALFMVEVMFIFSVIILLSTA